MRACTPSLKILEAYFKNIKSDFVTIVQMRDYMRVHLLSSQPTLSLELCLLNTLLSPYGLLTVVIPFLHCMYCITYSHMASRSLRCTPLDCTTGYTQELKECVYGLLVVARQYQQT